METIMVTVVWVIMALFALSGSGLVMSIWVFTNEKAQTIFTACTALFGLASVAALIVLALCAH